MAVAVTSFALAVEPVELVEERRECIREANFALRCWERSRDPADRERLLYALEVLARLVRGAGV